MAQAGLSALLRAIEPTLSFGAGLMTVLEKNIVRALRGPRS